MASKKKAVDTPAKEVIKKPEGPVSLRVASCVPAQKYSFSDKMDFAVATIKKHKPEVLVLPQEYHGGIQHLFFQDVGTTEKIAYTPDEIIGPYEKLAKKTSCGITVGAVVDAEIKDRLPVEPELQRRERIFIIDPKQGLTGYADKTMLPAYDHIDAHGKTMIYPEMNFENRAKAFDLCGARVSILFCWEAYSAYLCHAIARAQPDFVVEMIKFGVCGYPIKKKVDGESVVEGFGYGDDGGWVDHLQIAARRDWACPIICSTNSWNQPRKTGALMGQILPWEEKAVTSGDWQRNERKHSLWKSEGKGNLLEDNVQVDQVDYMYWRYIRDHKFNLFNASGEWPSSEARKYTMAWKIRRMERKMMGLPKLEAVVSVDAITRKAAKPAKQKSGRVIGQGLLALTEHT